jgi:diguanylate cyclase (GGDEF)-like protein
VSENATVLVADDSLVIRAVVRGQLEDEGYRVIEAEDGVAALQRCQECPPDVILLDIEMPGLDGHQVLAALKADVNLKDVPVVFLTIRANMQDVLAGLRGGSHDYLKKPFDPAELVARVGAAMHVKKLQDQLRKKNEELELISRTDVLTGLANRRQLDEQLQRYYQGTPVHGRTALGVILLDIDHFKLVNDTHGHPVGDVVLREVSRRLQGELRAGDVAGRWGGEEFLVLLPRTDLDALVHAAERIRLAVADVPVAAGEISVAVTVSAGCVAGPGGSPEELVHQADICLYQAKLGGRNRVVSTCICTTE